MSDRADRLAASPAAVAGDAALDADLQHMSAAQLADEVRRLRAGIRAHRDSSGHDLCWYHPQLWQLLPEQVQPSPEVPDWPQFMRGCIRYRQSLDAQCPQAPRSQQEFDAPPDAPSR